MNLVQVKERVDDFLFTVQQVTGLDWLDREDEIHQQATTIRDLLKKVCNLCGQVDSGQTGEYVCKSCGLPAVWDSEEAAAPPPREEE